MKEDSTEVKPVVLGLEDVVASTEVAVVVETAEGVAAVPGPPAALLGPAGATDRGQSADGSRDGMYPVNYCSFDEIEALLYAAARSRSTPRS